MNKNTITVIIPAYNCAAFVSKAIDSVISQDVAGLKILIIDDASTDNTLSVLQKYEANDAVNIIVNEVNKRQGAARNTGIEHTTSKYIFFLDADDWLSQGALARMQDIAETTNADVVASGMLLVDENGSEKPYYAYDYECSGGEEALELFSVYSLTTPACAKLYRREFITRYCLRFVEHYWHEDILFTAYVAKYCKKYISISDFYYNYYTNAASTTKGRQTPLHLESYFYVHKELTEFIKHLSWEGIGNEALYRRLFRNYGTLEFMPKFERYASMVTLQEFNDDVFAAAKAIFGINGYPLADAICSLFESNTKQF